VATAYFSWASRRLAEIARVLDYADDAVKHESLADEVAAACRAEWMPTSGRLKAESQTGYALAITFDLFDSPDDVQGAGRRLAELIREGGNRIGSGFAGVNLLADALTRAGEVSTAFDLLLERGSPSWLSMVDKGATTTRERWDSLLDDGTVNPGEMTSFNHYALGSIADWMRRVIGGIAPLEPGYRRIAFAPVPGPLTAASARLDSPYGTTTSEWRVVDGVFSLDITLPTGTSGIVSLIDGREVAVESGSHRYSCALEGQSSVA
jgi:alpha-L-rhamnosidase